MQMKIDKSWGSIMIIVPHQDDEILMSSGIIRECTKQNIPCTVVMATNGDYECKDFSKGYARLRESIEGIEVLGLSVDDYEIMGYADTGMPETESFLAHLYHEKDSEKIYPSYCGENTYGLPEKKEYCFATKEIHRPYNRKSFLTDLKEILMKKRPEKIFTTSGFDTHGDHSGLYAFVCEALDQLKEKENYTPQLYCGLIHSCAGDEVWPVRSGTTFTCPEGLEENNQYVWQERYVLKMPEEMCVEQGDKNLKLQALKKHDTALEPDAYEFLMAFIKNEEIFWKLR